MGRLPIFKEVAETFFDGKRYRDVSQESDVNFRRLTQTKGEGASEWKLLLTNERTTSEKCRKLKPDCFEL